MLKNRLRLLWVILVVVLLGSVVYPHNTQAQSPTVTITIAVPAVLSDMLPRAVLNDFESSHPGIKVQEVQTDVTFETPSSGDLTKYFAQLQDYAGKADLLYVDNNILTVESARAGYFLDLSPSANADNSLNTDDFYPGIWQSFQWDKAIWAIPTAANVYILSYRKSDFDRVGIAYPSAQWTVDDLQNAVEKLAVKDADGKVIVRGLDVGDRFGLSALFRSLIGTNLFDANQVPALPSLDNPASETLLKAWSKLDKDQVLGGAINKSAMSISSFLGLSSVTSDPNEKRTPVLLPGGKAGISAVGFAVSKGSNNPDQAYQLAAYLSTRPEVVPLSADTNARKSLSGQNGGKRLNIPAEYADVLSQALTNALSASDMRFADYVVQAALSNSATQGDVIVDIQKSEATLTANLKAADTQKGNLNVVVATPIPQAAGGKITLKFGVQSSINPLPNMDAWTQLMSSFTANDPDVGQIDFQVPSPLVTVTKYPDQFDCFYLSSNYVPDYNIAKLVNLDPLISPDQSFDKGDFIGNVLDQMTRDNKIWALPASIEPAVLQYDSDQFAKAGLPAPAGGWTISSFTDALKALRTDKSQPAPYASAGTGGTHLLLLIGAFGALPIDYRTNPPTINYTDPATVTAIQQVLDLAKQGYIKYDPVGQFTSLAPKPAPNTPIVSTVLNNFTARAAAKGGTNNPYKLVTYPKGTTVNALSYSIGTLYISKNAQNPDACYRWISAISKASGLFAAMPARKSQLNDPNLASLQGADTIALYNQFAQDLSAPNTTSIPSLLGAQRSFFYQFWLFGAFDDYVLKGKDLTSALSTAQQKSEALIACVNQLPSYDPTNDQAAQQYTKQYGDCVTKIDPAFGAIFSLVNG